MVTGVAAGISTDIPILPYLSGCMEATLTTTREGSSSASSKTTVWFKDAVISCEGLRNLTLDGQSFGLAFFGMILGVGVLVKKGWLSG